MISNLQADGIAPRCSPEFADGCPCCCYVCCKRSDDAILASTFIQRAEGWACSRRQL